MWSPVHPLKCHHVCPACRSRDVCCCGRPKQVKSKTCQRCRSRQTGLLNPNWKGGRTYHRAGYVMLLAPIHPRAGKSGYVFEHILLAEECLGRHPLPDETVHHVNGVRDDNRPANLEVWTRPQPSGLRARDALAWAREIIRRYPDLDELELNDALGNDPLGGGGDRTRVPNRVPCDLYERSPGFGLIPVAPWDQARRGPDTVDVPAGAVAPPTGKTACINVGSRSRGRGADRRQAVA